MYALLYHIILRLVVIGLLLMFPPVSWEHKGRLILPSHKLFRTFPLSFVCGKIFKLLPYFDIFPSSFRFLLLLSSLSYNNLDSSRIGRLLMDRNTLKLETDVVHLNALDRVYVRTLCLNANFDPGIFFGGGVKVACLQEFCEVFHAFIQ